MAGDPVTRPPAVVAERLDHQGLVQPLATVEEVVGRILAVQAQDDRGARLAVRSRTATGACTAADVDTALAERRLVVSWLNRGTLHLVRPEDEAFLHLLTAPRQRTANARRLAQEGVTPRDADRGVELIVQTLTDDGPRTRAQLRDHLDAAGVPTAGQAIVHLLGAATFRGHIVRGPMVGTHQAFVTVEGWLGPRPDLERDEALALLARRYLAGHGPADAADLATWVGLPLGDARRALAAIAGETDDRGDGLVALGSAPARVPRPPAPRLLGAFDPVLHGWASRAEIVGSHRGVVTANGVFRPIALVHGRAVATWGLAGGVLTVRPLEALDERTRRVLAADAADVLRYLGLPSAPPVWS